MPKIVDHDQRRHELIQATWDVILRDGVAGATVREIAREAGCSVGVLSHYFANKEEILIAAHRRAFESVGERVVSADARPGWPALRVALLESLPLDDLRYREAVLDVGFWSLSMTNADLRDVRRESIANARGWMLQLIEDARTLGELRTSEPDEVLCDHILALVDGLSMQAVLYPEFMTPARQRALAEAFLAEIRA